MSEQPETDEWAGSFEVKRTPAKLEIISAPDKCRLTLHTLRQMPESELSLVFDIVTFGGPLSPHEYRVKGWDAETCALLLERVKPA